MTEEAKAKASAAHKARWSTEEFRQRNLSKALQSLEAARGPVTDEARRKLSDSAKQRWADPEIRSRMRTAISLAKKGKHPCFRSPVTDEARKNLAEGQRRRWADPEKRRKALAALKSRRHTGPRRPLAQTAKETLSQKAKTRLSSPEGRAKHMTGRAKVVASESYRKKQSESRRKLWRESAEYCQKVLRALTKAGGSSLEDALATHLDQLGIKYERQVVIGRCIADFLVRDRNLIIEADGEYWHSKSEVQARDKRRDAWLRSKGYTVLRIDERDILADPKPLLAPHLTVTT